MAGLLGEIFSAGNVAKRKLTDLLGNPLLSAQQFVGNINDRARNLNEMTSAAAREGMDYGPATQRLAGLMAEGYNPMGLTVFHGSPAKFNRFDRTKIGSGEGAQAFGYGHYVAESPSVAREYQEKLSSTGGAKRLVSQFGQLDDAISEAQKRVTHYENLIKQRAENVPLDKANSFLKISKKNLQDLQDMKAGVPENKGALYEIDLPDEQIARMLDYDNPVDETIRSRVSQAAMEKFGSGSTGTSGELLYKELTREFQNLGSPNPAADASEFLRAQGVPGIKFLDQGSRSNFTVQNTVKGNPYGDPVSFMTEQQAKDYAAEQIEKGFGTQIIPGTSNFVVFPGNEDMLTILKRNGGLLD
jgi:hypothetical protein